jgi:RNA polymerase sigma-32 factor
MAHPLQWRPRMTTEQHVGASGLTNAAEHELVRRAKRGDEVALDQLIAAHQSLVGYIARSSSRHGCAVQDLMQQGQLGLLHAVRVFDPERGVRFWTYARWWVRAYIRNYVWQNRRIVPLSSNRTHRRVVMNIRKVEGRLGAASSADSIANVLSVDEDAVRRVQNALSQRDVTLSEPTPSTSGITAGSITPEDEVADRHARKRCGELLRQALEVLDARDREIVERRYLREDPETLASLGKRLGISRERVRQLSQRALRRLREELCDRDEAAPELVAAVC